MLGASHFYFHWLPGLRREVGIVHSNQFQSCVYRIVNAGHQTLFHLCPSCRLKYTNIFCPLYNYIWHFIYNRLLEYSRIKWSYYPPDWLQSVGQCSNSQEKFPSESEITGGAPVKCYSRTATNCIQSGPGWVVDQPVALDLDCVSVIASPPPLPSLVRRIPSRLSPPPTLLGGQLSWSGLPNIAGLIVIIINMAIIIQDTERERERATW